MEDRKRFHLRSNILVVAFLACLFGFICILYNAQIVHGKDYLAKSNTQVTTTQTVETSRGIITDRNGKILVSNEETYCVNFDPKEVPASSDPDVSQKQTIARAVLRLLKLCQEYGVTWTDGLPLSTEKPFSYTLSSVQSRERTYFQRYLADRGWSETELKETTAFPLMTEKLKEELQVSSRPLSANLLFQLMRKDFDIPEDFTDEEARLAMGVLYELSLRTLPKPNTVNIPYEFAKDVPVEVISILHDGKFDGVSVGIKTVRQYNTDYAAHILGRVAAIDTKEERDELNAPYAAAQAAGQDTSGIHYYQSDDKVGKDGVEKAFEKYLCGLEGKRLITTDRNGKITSELYSIEPRPGDTVSLTIDIDFQEKVEKILAQSTQTMIEEDGIENRGSAAAVVSVADGGILALANYPTYSQRTYLENYTELAEDPGHPFTNRALTGAYAPGSTFKPCTAVAAVGSGVITTTSTINALGKYTYWPDYQPWCWRRAVPCHGRINVSQAIFHSCNYFFYEVGRLMTIDVMGEYAAAFGLGQPTGVEIWENTGVMASPEYSQSQGVPWVGGNTIQAAIGQGDSSFTPLQLANYIATLVRGGERYGAHLLNNVISYDGSETVLDYEPEVLATVNMTEETLEAVKKGMGELASKGSISKYFADCVVTAGAKTGSAQLGDSNTNGVFVCFAPFEEPEIAVAVVIEKGGSGAAVASTAVEILNAYFSDSDIGAMMVPEGTLLP